MASFALLIWPVLSILFYRWLSLPVALSVTILGGYLFLPGNVGWDFPMLPEFNKITIPTITALLLTSLSLVDKTWSGHVPKGWLPRDPVVLVLMGLLMFGAFGTVMTNRDALTYGWRFIPGMTVYDAFSISLEFLLALGVFLLGRKVLSSAQAQRAFLMTLVVLAMGYSLLALWEVRMSPQLHNQIYGFYQTIMAQHFRASGFRPVVFLKHGLELSIFFCFAVLAAATLYKVAPQQDRLKWLLSMLWLFFVLVMSKSLGALLITLMLLPLILFAGARIQSVAAACIVGIVLSFPMMRSADLVPVDRMLALAAEVSPTRADSLRIRFENEDILLARAKKRPLFGWGSWGRNRVYAKDGRDASVTDGSWVIELGQGGWVRYLAVFGLLSWPILRLFMRRRTETDPVFLGLMFLVCAKLIDLIPNSGLGSLTWLAAGALAGRLELKSTDGASASQPSDVKPVRRRLAGDETPPPRYSRDFTTDKRVRPQAVKPARDGKANHSTRFRTDGARGIRK